MTQYLTDIDNIVKAEVERQTAELRAERDRALREAEDERKFRREDWREAHVAERIADYRLRWELAKEDLDDIIDAVSHEGDSAWMIVERVREIVGVER